MKKSKVRLQIVLLKGLLPFPGPAKDGKATYKDGKVEYKTCKATYKDRVNITIAIAIANWN